MNFASCFSKVCRQFVRQTPTVNVEEQSKILKESEITSIIRTAKHHQRLPLIRARDRQAILDCLKKSDRFLTTIEIAEHLNIPLYRVRYDAIHLAIKNPEHILVTYSGFFYFNKTK